MPIPSHDPAPPADADEPPFTKRGKRVANSVSVTGGTHVGGTIGAGKVDSHARVRVGDVSSGSGTSPTVDDLRAALEDLRDLLISAGATPDERADIDYEVRKIQQELAADEPSAAPVRSRWEEVSRVLTPVLATGTGIAEAVGKITDLIAAVFRTS